MTVATKKTGVFCKEEQQFCSQTDLNILMNAIEKYEKAVKEHIDPEIKCEETVLLVANIIETLADSMSKHLQEKQGVKEEIIDRITQIREKDLQVREYLKKQFIKFATGIISVSQRLLTRYVL